MRDRTDNADRINWYYWRAPGSCGGIKCTAEAIDASHKLGAFEGGFHAATQNDV